MSPSKIGVDGLAVSTRLETVESGFDHIPPNAAKSAFRMNGEGWQQQAQKIESCLSKN